MVLSVLIRKSLPGTGVSVYCFTPTFSLTRSYLKSQNVEHNLQFQRCEVYYETVPLPFGRNLEAS